MRKIVALLLALLLIMAMAIPAFAVTPHLEIPDMPEIPTIKPDFGYIDFERIFDKWFEDHPIRIESVRLLR